MLPATKAARSWVGRAVADRLLEPRHRQYPNTQALKS